MTTLRVMLEYVGDGLYLERRPGEFDPVTVQAVDDLVALCERHGLRLLLTPFDTFFTWVMWDDHPYNAGRGGPCRRRLDLLTQPEGMAAVKRRIAFAVERWGGSGAVFAWDLWNELGHHHGVEAEAIDAGDGAGADRRSSPSSRRTSGRSSGGSSAGRTSRPSATSAPSPAGRSPT